MARQTTHYKPGRSRKTPNPTAPMVIRGFVRGALVDPDGTVHLGDWHENAITTRGVQQVMNMYAMTTATTATGEQGVYLGVGNHTTAITSNATALQTEYASSTTGGVVRKVPTISTSAYGTLSYTAAYAATDITATATINAVGIFANSSVGAGSAHSIATFNSSTKGSTQALNITYTWNFATS